ncbi:zinc finger CCCH domain-containing protein 18-like [Hibiscus syriacus]|uniref:zinc finger CCCH domain-containing protein 18-like n=1 Tax=Hibiscus syriacus TaxID=106335 RepID=UPI001921EEC7|nr:zinc finger CCCH domain-containing protein 18-like [Hibiscus syriacus]XP_039058767.1 zinc finger CCCH domain-containing protein 18-like [Hibiscus syriacus]
MEFSDHTRMLFNRINKMDPENVTKIIGYLFLQEYDDQEIFQLATWPDIVLEEVIYKSKLQLQHLKSMSPLISPSMNPVPVSPSVSSKLLWSPRSVQMTSPYWKPQLVAKQSLDFTTPGYLDSMSDLQAQTQLLSLEDPVEFVENGGFSIANRDVKVGHRCQNLHNFPVKTCHYFNKGYCKHGSNCRYFHGQISDSFPQKFIHNSTDAVSGDHDMSLENLEVELVELLKTKRGDLVSITSLPLLYYEKYGKVLQADGYLTDSQRHGKSGYSLTKLLARLKNVIRVIEKPHGQHFIILAEDAPKYTENRNDPGPIVSGSRQIYLTFPAESTFSEDDVSNYFSNYGQVEDVRIPCQQKRMFGFVTFVSADAVKIILAKGDPHYVCGARVLVKPYREKPKLVFRKYQERIESPMFYSPHYIDMESQLHSIPRGYATSRLYKKQFVEDPEKFFQPPRRLHPSEMYLAHTPQANQSFFTHSMDELKLSEDHLSFLLEAINTGTASDEKTIHVETDNNDQESDGFNQPDIPFFHNT